MTPFFITSCGTGIGKTLVASILCRQLREKGHQTQALKPVISGYPGEEGEESDTHVILKALERETSDDAIAAISPWRFKEPLSPHMAAAREGRRIDLGELIAFCRKQADCGEGILLVEGVGGVMAPLSESETVLDWMTGVGFPAVLVVGSYLGSLSHAMTAAKTLSAAGIEIASIIVSQSEGSPYPLDEAVSTLAGFLGPVPVVALPYLADLRAAPDLTAFLESRETR
jgi:dethiobiotin synthetase